MGEKGGQGGEEGGAGALLSPYPLYVAPRGGAAQSSFLARYTLWRHSVDPGATLTTNHYYITCVALVRAQSMPS